MTDIQELVEAALERWKLNMNAEAAPFGNPHGGLDCDESGYEMIPGMNCCYRVYGEDGEYDIDHAMMHPCSMNDSCREWERRCREADDDRATILAAIEESKRKDAEIARLTKAIDLAHYKLQHHSAAYEAMRILADALKEATDE